MTIEELNKLQEPKLMVKLLQCCGSSTWMTQLIRLMPFMSLEDLLTKSDQAWQKTDEKDWLEAFSHHPKIGDLKSLEQKFASTKVFAQGEQSSVSTARHETLEQLAEGNSLYEKKFGFIFIVFATGKSAEEMLVILNQRISNDRSTELRIAAGEQQKITKLRLQKLIS